MSLPFVGSPPLRLAKPPGGLGVEHPGGPPECSQPVFHLGVGKPPELDLTNALQSSTDPSDGVGSRGPLEHGGHRTHGPYSIEHVFA